MIYQYDDGDGNDVIKGFVSNDILHIMSGSYTTSTVGTDFIVNVGSGSITLKNVLANKSEKIRIRDASGKTKIFNDWDVLRGTDGNDTLTNETDRVTVDGGAGNDSLVLSGATRFNVTLDGGDGNDTLRARNNFTKMYGGNGNDYIYNSSFYVTINGGKGNDTIYGGKHTQYGAIATPKVTATILFTISARLIRLR